MDNKSTTTLLKHNTVPYIELELMLSRTGKAMYVAATGAGKTSVAVKYLEAHDLYALVVCPQISLCQQWNNTTDRVETMTYQAFAKNPDVSRFDCYIFDEAHHTGASKWGKAVKALMDSTTKPVIGLIADPKRYLDGGRDMGYELWDGNIVYGLDLNKAIEKKVLPGGIFVCALFDAGAELEKYRNVPVTKTLKGRLDTCLENCMSIQEILHRHMPEGKRKGIVFADSIERVQEGVALIKAAYPSEQIWFIHSMRPQKENIETLLAFNKAEHGFIVTVDMLNEGVHVPGVNTIIMLRRTSSPNIFMQQLGRGFTPGSKDVAIFDFVGNNSGLKIISGHIDYAKGITNNQTGLTNNNSMEFSSQFIVYDYATPVVKVITDIKNFLSDCWTEEEDAILRANYATMGRKVASLLPGRTMSACWHRAQKLGLTKAATYNCWTENEDNILRTNYANMGRKITTLLNGKTWKSCKIRAAKLGVSMVTGYWTADEDNILRTHYTDMGREILDLLPGRTWTACKARARQFGLGKSKGGAWTESEDSVLRTNYASMGTKVASLLPGRTGPACKRRAEKLGLTTKNNLWTEVEDEMLRTNYTIIGPKATALLVNRTQDACKSRAKKLGLTVKQHPWSKAEDDILRANYIDMGSKIVTLLPDRNWVSCKRRATRIGLLPTETTPKKKVVFWTESENDTLRANYVELGANVVALLPGRTWVACQARAAELGLTRKNSRPWTKNEDSILQSNYADMGPSKVTSLLPGRTREACQNRATELGLTKKHSHFWTETEDDVLRTNYANMGASKIASLLPGRTPGACRSRAVKLGVTFSNITCWTDAEDDILRKNYTSMGSKIVTLLPKRTLAACKGRARQLGLTENRQWVASEDDILRTNYVSMGPSKITSLLPERSPCACRTRAQFLGLTKTRKGAWTEDEDNILKSNYVVMGASVSTMLPGRSQTACQARAQYFGLTKSNEFWTENEDDILRMHYTDMGTKVADLLPGRTRKACQGRARQLGLKYNP